MPKSKAMRTLERERQRIAERFENKEITGSEYVQARKDLFERLGPKLTTSELEAEVDHAAREVLAAENLLHDLKRSIGLPVPGNDADKPN